MQKAINKKKLLDIIPISFSTIRRLEKKGCFPKRFYILDRCAWDAEEVSNWLEKHRNNQEFKYEKFKS